MAGLWIAAHRRRLSTDVAAGLDRGRSGGHRVRGGPAKNGVMNMLAIDAMRARVETRGPYRTPWRLAGTRSS